MDFAKLLAEERAKASSRTVESTSSTIKSTKPTKPTTEKQHQQHVNQATLNFPSFTSTTNPTSSHPPLHSPHINGISYYPNYLAEEMAAKLRDAVYSCRSDKWVTLPTTRRRLQEWGGRPAASDVTVKGPFPLPTYQLQLAQRLVQEQIFDATTLPNHVLINAYSPGQGILPHTDGNAYYPKVAILSLNQPVIMSFRKQLSQDPITSVVLEPRSLIVFEKEAYEYHLHSIDDCITENTKDKNVFNVKQDMEIERKSERISLTLRYVPSLDIKTNLNVNQTEGERKDGNESGESGESGGQDPDQNKESTNATQNKKKTTKAKKENKVKQEEPDECPICLDALPRLTHQYVRFSCCGKGMHFLPCSLQVATNDSIKYVPKKNKFISF